MKLKRWGRAGIGLLALVWIAGCGRSHEPGFLGSGTLEATEVVISAQTGGTITDLTREEGQKAAAGDLLAVIDVEKLELQRNRLAAGLAEVAANRIAADAAVAQAEETLANVETQYRRIKELHDRGSATQKQLDDITTQLAVAKNQVAGARAQLPMLDAKKAQIEAEMALADRQIADGRVTSPINGTVVEKYMEAGETAMPGSRIYKLADLGRFWVHIYVAAEDLGNITIGQKAEVRADAVDTPFTGTIAWTSPEAEFTPKNVQTRKSRSELVYAVKVILDAGADVLKIGMPVEVYAQP
ncbi:MAG: efflux RND transporter periplasmic adaptor subunit [Thermodesulfobacteriota bacterium]|nr:efflux RND transporter periplasmic adaptor subunit [Thermodesulfobacteriota bacterium]